MDDVSADSFSVGAIADVAVERADGSYDAPGIRLDLSSLAGGLGVGGRFRFECFDRDGNRRWVDDAKNAVTNPALDDILNTYLRNGSTVSVWYGGLVDNAGFTSFAASDTMASHAGWVESAAYGTATRQAWTPAASSNQSVTNPTAMSFTMNAQVTIRGAFICSDPSSNSSGVKLFCTAPFSTGSQSLNIGDVLKVTYIVGAQAV